MDWPPPAHSQAEPSKGSSVRSSLCVVALVLLAGSPLAAQGRPLQVRGQRAITFGTVLPGVPLTVSRTDPANSGEFELRGQKDAQVQLTFSLPPAMTGPAAATMPLAFGGGDAGYSATQSIAAQVGFDPSQPFLARLSNNGRASVFLGGTVNPGTGQRAGAYTATITLSVAYTGL
jgi:uncharacterized protein DUF4402